MDSSIKQFAALGIATVNQANSNLNGTGPMQTVLTAPTQLSAGPSQGTVITSLIVKALGNSSEGQIRLYVNSSGVTTLYSEIYIPEITDTTILSYQTSLDVNLTLLPGESLMASTQNADSGYNVIANGYSWINCPFSTGSAAEALIVPNTGLVSISIANGSRTGNGAIATVLTASPGVNAAGTYVAVVDVKATGSTDQGAIKYFVTASGVTSLIWEVPVTGTTQVSTSPAFRTRTVTELYLPPNNVLGAATLNANSFNVIAFGGDTSNLACS